MTHASLNNLLILLPAHKKLEFRSGISKLFFKGAILYTFSLCKQLSLLLPVCSAVKRRKVVIDMFKNNEHDCSVEWIWYVGSCLLTFVTETFSLVYSHTHTHTHIFM